MTTGRITAVSLVKRASPQHAREPIRRRREGVSQFRIHKHRLPNKLNAISESVHPETHATVSTWAGCTAKIRAPTVAHLTSVKYVLRTTSTTNEAPACKVKLVKCQPQECVPHRK